MATTPAEAGPAPSLGEDGTEILCRLALHFAGGTVAHTTVTEGDLEDEEGCESVEQLIDKALDFPNRPHWAWLGDVRFYTQAVSGIQIV